MLGWLSVSLLVWFSFRSHYWVWRPLLEAGSLGFRTHHLHCRCVNSRSSQAGRMGYSVDWFQGCLERARHGTDPPFCFVSICCDVRLQARPRFRILRFSSKVISEEFVLRSVRASQWMSLDRQVQRRNNFCLGECVELAGELSVVSLHDRHWSGLCRWRLLHCCSRLSVSFGPAASENR